MKHGNASTGLIVTIALVAAVVVIGGGLVYYVGWHRGPMTGHDRMHDNHAGHGHGDHDGSHMDYASMDPSGRLVDGTRVVEVEARQFEFDPSTIVVGQGETVRLELTSADVTHGFRLSDYDIDRELPPGEPQTVEFTATKVGRHHFHCSVPCGEGHDRMHGELIVKPADGQ